LNPPPPKSMPQLVISVRSADEVLLADQAGVDVLDIKEPSRGSLGSADPDVIVGILNRVRRDARVSVACGELADWRPGLWSHLPAAVEFAKIGLAGCQGLVQWPAFWDQWRAELPTGTGAVMCCYADWQRARAPHPEEALCVAEQFGAEGILIDTWSKKHGALLDVAALPRLESLVDAIRRRGFWFALAGQLDATVVPTCCRLSPSYLAFRSAVCREDRTRSLDASRVRSLVIQLQAIFDRNHDWFDENRTDGGQIDSFR